MRHPSRGTENDRTSAPQATLRADPEHRYLRLRNLPAGLCVIAVRDRSDDRETCHRDHLQQSHHNSCDYKMDLAGIRFEV